MKAKLIIRFIIAILASIIYAFSLFTWMNCCVVDTQSDFSTNVNITII